MVPLEGLEPPTRDLGRRRSIQLSYRGRLVEIGGLEPHVLVSSIPAQVQSNQAQPFLTCPQRPSEYRQALTDALRAVAAAGEALVALAEALERPQTAQWPPENRRGPQCNIETPYTSIGSPRNGNGDQGREVGHGGVGC